MDSEKLANPALSAAELAFLREENRVLKEKIIAFSMPGPWANPGADDAAIDEEEFIKASHPLRSGNFRLFADAMRMVGAKRSKYALIELVNWLLHEIHGLKVRREHKNNIIRAAREVRNFSQNLFPLGASGREAWISLDRALDEHDEAAVARIEAGA